MNSANVNVLRITQATQIGIVCIVRSIVCVEIIMFSLKQQQAEFAKHSAQLITYINSCKYSVTLGEAFRTPEQAEIYAKSGAGIKDSLHCDRLAVDLNLIDPDGKYLTATESYAQFGVFWESLDKQNVWGGRFKERPDGNHFQRNKV